MGTQLVAKCGDRAGNADVRTLSRHRCGSGHLFSLEMNVGWMVLPLAAGEEDEATRVAQEAMSIAVVPLVPHAHPEGTAAAAHLPTESQTVQSIREQVSRGSYTSPLSFSRSQPCLVASVTEEETRRPDQTSKDACRGFQLLKSNHMLYIKQTFACFCRKKI